MDFTRQEMMAIATGREIQDGDLCIFGVGLSMLAGYFALAMTEGGVYGSSLVGDSPGGLRTTAYPRTQPASPAPSTRWGSWSPRVNAIWE